MVISDFSDDVSDWTSQQNCNFWILYICTMNKNTELLKDKWMNEWMNGWINELMNYWKDNWMNEWSNKQMNKQTNNQSNEQTNKTCELLSERKNEWTGEFIKHFMWINEIKQPNNKQKCMHNLQTKNENNLIWNR